MSSVTLLPGTAIPEQPQPGATTAHYYAAEDLAEDCVSHDSQRQNQCFGVMQGVLGALVYLHTNHTPFAQVLCLPDPSVALVKDAFLAAFFAHRKELTGLLAG